jgi:hypothetical protein
VLAAFFVWWPPRNEEALLSLEHSPTKQRRRAGSAIPPSAADDLRCITVKQFAELVGFSTMTAKRLLRAGEGPPTIALSARRIGIRIRDLAAWQQARVRP